MKYEINPKILKRIKNVKQAIQEIEDWYSKKPSRKRWQYWSLTRFLSLQGVRISEALTLTWDNVDLFNKTALIRQLKKRKETMREIPLHPKVVEAFEKYTERQGKVWKISRIAAYLFYRKYGINPHVFRHNFAISLLKKGIDLETIRRVLGHSGYSYLKVYLDLNLEDVREKIEQISLF